MTIPMHPTLMRRSAPRRIAVGVLGLLAALAALWLTGTPALAQPAREPVTILLDWFINPDHAPIIEAAHAVGARVYIDAVAWAPHKAIDIAALGCDALVTSPYKWYGPHTGVL